MKDLYVGEMDTDETEEALVDPNTRIIQQVSVSDIGKAEILFSNLMGENVSARKKFIEDNSEKAGIYV